MGELPTSVAKARMELEELYLGIPDDSVNLTFQDLADMKQKANPIISDKKKSATTMEPLPEGRNNNNNIQPKQHGPPLIKLPSLDFNNGLQATRSDHSTHKYNYHQRPTPYFDHHDSQDDDDDDNFDNSDIMDMDKGMHHHQHHHRHHDHDGKNMHSRDVHHAYGDHQSHRPTTPSGRSDFRHVLERSAAFDDVSVVSMASNYTERGQRRRPGIPHSNICTICCTYIYIFRHRCLVCGRVYCRQCVCMGMGEMTEGRKCIPCLGRRFSQRYIKRAGKMSCVSRYSSSVKQAELKWAEKGPRKRGERLYGQSVMMMSSRPTTPTRSHATNTNNMAMAPPSFVASSPAYSPYTTPRHHHLPL